MSSALRHLKMGSAIIKFIALYSLAGFGIPNAFAIISKKLAQINAKREEHPWGTSATPTIFFG